MALLTQKTVKFLGIVGLVAVTAVGATVVAQPMFNSIQSQASDIQNAKDGISSMTTQRDQLQKAKVDYPQVQKVNDQLSRQFPSLAQVPELLDTITAGAVSVGIDPSNITSITFAAPTVKTPTVPAATGGSTSGSSSSPSPSPSPSPSSAPPAPAGAQANAGVGSGGDYATMDVGISIQGSPEQTQQFLTYLNKMDRAMIIKKFSVDIAQKDNAGIKASLSLTGTVFVYKAILTPTEQANQTKTQQPQTGNAGTSSNATPAPSTGK